MPTTPYLRPASADELRPRPAPQASAGEAAPVFAPLQPSAPQAHLRPAAFPAESEDPLAQALAFLGEEIDEEDDDEPDTVPTESMPVPACVPLFDFSPAPRRGLFGKKG